MCYRNTYPAFYLIPHSIWLPPEVTILARLSTAFGLTGRDFHHASPVGMERAAGLEPVIRQFGRLTH